MSNPLRIAVAGVGFGATVHIPAFQSEGLEVVGVYSRREERARETAEKFGIPNVFTDYDEMLKLDGLDAVSIVTPASAHHEMVMKALKAGKHIICEKPFSVTEAEAREMYQAAEAAGLTGIIAHEFRYSSGRSAVKELIDQGYIGNLRFALIRMVMSFPPAMAARPMPSGPGNGFLFGAGSHYIDALRHWFGEVASASGTLANFSQGLSPQDVLDNYTDDTFSFRLEFVEGGFAEMFCSRAGQFGSGVSFEVYGDEGTLFTPQTGGNPPSKGVIIGGKTGESATHEIEVPARLHPIEDARDDRLPPFRLQVRDFIKGIESGTSPAPNFYDGWRNQQVMEAIRESALTGKTVMIAHE